MSIPAALTAAATRPRPHVIPASPPVPIDPARHAVRNALADAVPDGWLVLYGSHDTDRASVTVRHAHDDAAPAVHVSLTDAARWGSPGVVAHDVSRGGRSVYSEHPADVAPARVVADVLALIGQSS